MEIRKEMVREMEMKVVSEIEMREEDGDVEGWRWEGRWRWERRWR
jgi:hypothetical protein